MIPDWLSKYIGLPFEERGRDWSGLDCWGLSKMVYQQELGIELPSYTESYRTTTDRIEIRDLIQGATEPTDSTPWFHVERTDAQPFDIVILRIQGFPMHCGVVVDPPKFLHVTKGIDAGIERWDATRWRYRVCSFWRHELVTALARGIR